MNEQFLKIVHLANLDITEDHLRLLIRSKFRWNDKSLWGQILLILLGAFMTVITFVRPSDTAGKVLAIFLGLFLITMSVLSLLRQYTDRIMITDKDIQICYKLRNTLVLLDKSLKVSMKTEVIEIRRSTFRMITHYLQLPDKEMPVLQFLMYYADTDLAFKLGNEITQLLNRKIRRGAHV